MSGASELAYAVAARFDNLVSDSGGILFGPWTAWNPLSNSWAVKSPYTGAWVRRAPGNTCQISALMTPGTDTDLTTVGTIPSSDSDGNTLRPLTTQDVPLTVDQLRQSGTPFEGASLRILTDGTVQCFGVAGAATRAAVNAFYCLDSM